MASVWKRLQRVNKKAAKFQYTASYHRIDLETTARWKPNKLSIVWTRRSRRVVTEPCEWEPSLKDPLKGSVIFTAPVNHTVAVTLFKDSRNELEDKEWTFVLEDVSPFGKRRRLAQTSLNMSRLASLTACQRALTLTLTPLTHKISAASVQLTMHCVLLKEGNATDEDMQSLASLLSVNNNSDIAVLEDLDEDDYTLSDNSTKQMSDFRQQMEEMTQSLTNSDIASPNSVQSLTFDSRTPTETEDKPKRPEFLSNLTKLTMNMKDPKFSSTPIKTPEIQIQNDDLLQPKTYKTVVNRNLKPLDLKINLNDINQDNDNDKTPVNEDKIIAFEKDKTPVCDLIEWCRSVTKDYHSVNITDFNSFKSGLAFCAIIHRFRPDLIDFSGLSPLASSDNVRRAIQTSTSLGVPCVLSVSEVQGEQPDKLAIMTYLFQLRAYFTGNELQVEQLGDESESSYMVGRHDTDGDLPPELFTREVSMRRSRNIVRDKQQEPQKPQTPDKVTSPGLKDVKQLLVAQSRSFLGKMRQDKPTTNWFTSEPPPARPEVLMTRKELNDPFGSDEEDEIHAPGQINGGENTPKQEQITTPIQVQTDPLLNPLIDSPVKECQSPFDSQTDRVNTQNVIEESLGKDSQVGNDIQLCTESQPDQSQLNKSQGDQSQLHKSQGDQSHLNKSLPDKSQSQPVSQIECQTDKLIHTPELPKPPPQLLSRHDELKEKARLLLEATRKEAREKERNRRQRSKEKEDNIDSNGVANGEISPSKKPPTEEERQAILRERARKLIADARQGVISPTSPLSPLRRSGTVEVITRQSVMDEIAAAGGAEQLDAFLRKDSIPSTPGSRKSSSPDPSERITEDSRSIKSNTEEKKKSPLHSFSAMLDRLTPDKEEPQEKGSYIQSELEALEREQRAIDEKAASLEKLLRQVMEDNDNSEEEAKLMSQWFNLVNKKNALLRRQMQLNILEQEEDLSRRCELLARELRLSLAVEEWRKTPGQKRRELLLLQDLLAAVNERDRLVQEMDEQEKAIADDDEIERNLSQVDMNRKNNCILQ